MKRLLLFAVLAIAVSMQAKETPYSYNVIVKEGRHRIATAIAYGVGEEVVINESAPLSEDQPLTFSKTTNAVTYTVRVIPVIGGEVVTTYVVQLNGDVIYREDATIPSGKLTSDAELISLQLKDADLNDVLETFATMTGRRFTKEPSVNGAVTINASEISWQAALTRAVAPLGLWPRMMEDGSVVLLRMPK
ncbi:MAG TPA: hypothetical protein VF787_02490 [Thermoanaerobaculia bacterium]